MIRVSISLAVLLLPVAAVCNSPIDFNREIRPIFSDKCFACHGHDAAQRKSPLRLDTEAGARITLSKGRYAIVPGSPDASELFKRITSGNAALRMPPPHAGHDRLSDSEISTVKRWIEEGAVWQKHWAFLPPVRPVVPKISDLGFVRSPIDAFVLAGLEAKGWHPAPEASRETLIRRVTLDLTGLPPTPEEVTAFREDHSANAYEALVDRLLASPAYAERMAIRWLEAARYSDTNGYQSDGPRDMWRWRDWVINAFRTNMPFDRFTIEQLAGDLLPAATQDQKVASGFHRNHRTNAEGGIVPEEFRVEYVADRAETTSAVWLGLTVGCARCHDHKYDPITQKDFYRLFAFFNNVPEKGLVYNFGNEEPYMKAPTDAQKAKLAFLDQQKGAAAERYIALQPQLRKAQHQWEKTIARRTAYDWQVTDGLVLQALNGEPATFDGKNFIDAGDKAKFDYLDPFTLAAWINPETSNGAILSRMEDYWEGEGYSLHLKDGKIRLHITKRWTDIGMRLETEILVPLHRASHVAVTYDGRRKPEGVHIYLNGQPQTLKVLFDDLNYPISFKDPFRIGAGGGPENRFHGTIADVRAYNRALTAQEVATLPLRETVNQIARIPKKTRTEQQAGKLALCFLEKFAPRHIQTARAEMLATEAERVHFYESVPTVMVMAESKQPHGTFLLKRGAYDAPGDELTPGVPEALPPMQSNLPLNRLGLARWLTDRANPLTARVAVNRFWQHYFGIGLVKTAEDFGAQGEAPSHPELLDWLAFEFMDSGWDVKAMQKLLVTSAVYRQSSKAAQELLANDPENRLLARGPRVRLPAEAIRDQALAVSGLLVRTVGGPSVKPYQPDGLWQELAGGKGYVPDKGDGLYRRSLYTYWKRTIAPPSMVLFDSPTRETCTVRQGRTNTPLQALNLMNDKVYLESARKLAERMLQEGGSGSSERLRYGWRLVLARPPKPSEADVLSSTLHRFQTYYSGHRDEATQFVPEGTPELAAYTAVASLMLNLDETITKQ